ncbi:snaclec 5-like [Clarias gariepinus]
MDGHWFWLSGESTENFLSLPPCPAQPYYCGAFNSSTAWENRDCNEKLNFLCYKKHLILVKENKTWEEALSFCTTNYTGLASLPDATQVLQAKTEIALTQTVNVWTGLRFMDGNWFWLSGESTVNQDYLPSCPAQPYHCGALKTPTSIWENRDCNEKLNFLCYEK